MQSCCAGTSPGNPAAHTRLKRQGGGTPGLARRPHPGLLRPGGDTHTYAGWPVSTLPTGPQAAPADEAACRRPASAPRRRRSPRFPSGPRPRPPLTATLNPPDLRTAQPPPAVLGKPAISGGRNGAGRGGAGRTRRGEVGGAAAAPRPPSVLASCGAARPPLPAPPRGASGGRLCHGCPGGPFKRGSRQQGVTSGEASRPSPGPGRGRG